MEKTWVKILQALRARKNYALFGLVSQLDDVSFTDHGIVIHSHNPAELSMLNHHLALLRELAGDTAVTIQDDTQTVQTVNQDYVRQLVELFGDKVEIV